MAEQKVEALHLLKIQCDLGMYTANVGDMNWGLGIFLWSWNDFNHNLPPWDPAISADALSAVSKNFIIHGVKYVGETLKNETEFVLVKWTGKELGAILSLPAVSLQLPAKWFTGGTEEGVCQFYMEMASMAEAAPYMTSDGTVQALMNLMQSIRQSLKI